MKNTIKILAVALLGMAAVACGSAKKMAEQAENVTVECSPAVLEMVAGQATAKVTVTYPEGYFYPKATLEVTPVVVYDGGELELNHLMYQGEKVQDNYTVVPSAGGSVTETITFPYVKGMEKSYLELRGVATYKGKSCALPTKKVADGCNTTYMLVCKDGKAEYKADEYQDIIKITEEGQILYNINSADVQSKQIKGQSIKDFQAAIDEANANERKTIASTEVVAYASPDGGEALNSKLSDKRAKSASKAWKTVTKGHDAAAPEVKSVGQDWEGFQELVGSSNIEDKDLILRVLSMYSDPAVRESEIKNMSEVYTELKGSVLPELRRARFIANVEYTNYTADELKTLIDQNIDVLDEEALLHAASLVDTDKKIGIYNKAISKFGSDRAQYNLAVAYLEKGDNAAAEKALAAVKADDAFVQNAKGVIALRKGDLAAAEKAFAAAGSETAKANEAAVLILNGKYAEAAKTATGFNKALALVLTGNTAAAASELKCDCPKSAYLKAVIAARKGDTAAVKSNLENAYKCADLKARAAKDIEFAGIAL